MAPYQGINVTSPLGKNEHIVSVIAEDERVTDALNELLRKLRVQVSPSICDHSMATALLSASIARVMGLDIAEVFRAGVVGALHEVGALVVAPPTEAESLRMAESRFMLEKARFRLASVDVLARIPVLARFAVPVGELYTDTLTSTIARVVTVADWYDWFCSPGDGQRPACGSREALIYLERNAGVRFHRDVVAALRDLTTGKDSQNDLELA